MTYFAVVPDSVARLAAAFQAAEVCYEKARQIVAANPMGEYTLGLLGAHVNFPSEYNNRVDMTETQLQESADNLGESADDLKRVANTYADKDKTYYEVFGYEIVIDKGAN